MSVTASTTTGFRIKGWHVAAIIVGFFTLVVALDATFAVIAMRTFPGEVSATPYEDGVAYNRKLAQLTAQAERGWRATAAVTPAGDLVVTLKDKVGAPVHGATVTATLERPATETGRRRIVFVESEAGVYGARSAGLHGAWDLSLVARDPSGARLEAERRLIWP